MFTYTCSNPIHHFHICSDTVWDKNMKESGNDILEKSKQSGTKIKQFRRWLSCCVHLHLNVSTTSRIKEGKFNPAGNLSVFHQWVSASLVSFTVQILTSQEESFPSWDSRRSCCCSVAVHTRVTWPCNTCLRPHGVRISPGIDPLKSVEPEKKSNYWGFFRLKVRPSKYVLTVLSLLLC